MPGFWKTLKRSLGDAYDYLGLVLLCSFVWFGITLGGLSVLRLIPSIFARFAFLAGFYVLITAPLTAGVFAVAGKIVTRDDPSPLDVFRGAGQFLTLTWRLALGQLIVTVLILANAAFYLTHESLWIKAIGVLFVYAGLVWALSAMYHYPILIEQRPGVLKVLKRGLLLTLDNPAFTVGVFSVIILLTCFCGITLLGLPLLYMGVASIFQTRALRALFVKYELLPPEREPVSEEEGAVERKAIRWRT